jgi:ribonuclease E
LGHLVQLPGESEAEAGEVPERVVIGPKTVVPSPSPSLDGGARIAPPQDSRIPNPAEPAYREESEGATAEMESGGTFPELELLNHPSYQDIGGGSNIRRRRRRRIGDMEPLVRDEESPRASLRVNSGGGYNETRSEAGTSETGPSRPGLAERVRSPKSETMKPVPEPQEVVAVEMTGDEQDVYALMGISPLLLSNQPVKSARNAIVTVRMPGETPKPLSTILEEEQETVEEATPAPVPAAATSAAAIAAPEAEPEPEAEPVEDLSPDFEDEEDAEEMEESELSSNGDDEADLDDSEEDAEDEGRTPIVRRRRRRSSAVSE